MPFTHRPDVQSRIEGIGVPPRLISRYGAPEQRDHDLELDAAGIRARVARFLET